MLISFSKDGLNWSPWHDVLRSKRFHDYPVIISTGDDNEVISKQFWIYYRYDPDDKMAKKFGVKQMNHVLVTLETDTDN